MALLTGAGTRFGLGPGRAFSGVASIYGAGYAQQIETFRNSAGANANFVDGWHRIADVTDKAGLPSGYRPPYCWRMPRVAGALSSRKECVLTVQGSADGAMGLSRPASATITVAASAIGGLVAGGVATGTITISGTAAAFAAIGGAASGSIVIGAAASATAIGHAQAAGVITVDGSVVPFAIGHMGPATTDFGAVLTPNNLATAVWRAIAADNNVAGSMGAKLNSAASGGVDLNALAAAVWDHADATAMGAKVALVEKILRNKTVTDPATGDFVLYDDDGSTELFRVALWENAGATQRYRGQGGERRERLA